MKNVAPVVDVLPSLAPEDQSSAPPEDTTAPDGLASDQQGIAEPVGVAPVAPGADPEPVASPASETPATLPGIAEPHLRALEGFDPEVHAVDESGMPKYKADGTLAKKRGRKAGSAPAARSALPPPTVATMGDAGSPGGIFTSPPGTLPEATPVAPARAVMSSLQAAKTAANLTIWGTVIICGQEIGEPKDKEEATALRDAYKDYFDARGVKELPPEVGLIAAIAIYVLPRVTHEKVRPRFERVKLWAHNVFQKIGGK